MHDKHRTLLLLFLGDTATDRRVQNFQKFFELSGWNVELLAITPRAKHGPRKFFEYHRKLAQIVRTKHVDAVLACDLYSLSAAAWLKRHKRAEILIYDAREVYTELPTVTKKPLAKFVWKTLERRGLAITDIIVTTGPHDFQAICDIHGFLPRPILVRNLPWYKASLTRDRSLLDRFDIPRGASVLVYVGGLQEGRGLKQIIQQVAESGKWKVDNIVSQFPIHLLLIGDGVLRRELDHLAQESGVETRVHFAGGIASEETMDIIAACDAGISLIEPISRSYELALPSKLFEYMMAGIPVISSSLSQVTELFHDEEWITFVNPNDPTSIQEGIRKALAISTNETCRQTERNLALQKFHFEHDARSLLRAMERVANLSLPPTVTITPQ